VIQQLLNVIDEPEEIIQNKVITQEFRDAILAEEVVPASGEMIGPKKPSLPTPKQTLTDEDIEQLEIISKMFSQAESIIMYEEQSAIQIDFASVPVILSDTIRNLEDRGYDKIAEFPCKCNCGGYSVIIARNF